MEHKSDRRIVLLDPRANTPAYDTALLGGLLRHGENVTLLTADFYPEPYAPESVVPGRRYYFLRLSRRMRRRFRRNVAAVRCAMLLGPIEYVFDIARLAVLCAFRRPLVHIIWPFVVPLDIVFLAFLRLLGIRIVYTVHNPLPHDKETALNRLLYGALYSLVDELIFHCRPTLEDFANHFSLDRKKWSIVPCGVFFGNWEPLPREEARRRLGWSAEETIIVFEGHVKPYKGLDVLLDAVAKMAPIPNARLVVSANFRFADRAEYLRLFEAARQKIALEVIDEIPSDKRFVEITCAADLFVLPYRSGTASVPGMAAVRFGTPMIVTRVGALPEMLGEGKEEFIVEPGNSDELARALQHFLELDLEERRAYSESLKERGRSVFNWDGIARLTMDIYNKLD